MVSKSKHNKHEKDKNKEGKIIPDNELNREEEDISSQEDKASQREIMTEVDILAEEIKKLRDECEKYKDSFYRKAAEFENYKRRTENEISVYIRYASEHLIKELIPVYDDLNRSVGSIEKGETNDFETLKKGVLLIQEKFRKILEKEGLKEIDSLGKEFDVNLHDALLQVKKDDVKSHTVVEVVEKGYLYKDKVLKHAKVIVSE